MINKIRITTLRQAAFWNKRDQLVTLQVDMINPLSFLFLLLRNVCYHQVRFVTAQYFVFGVRDDS